MHYFSFLEGAATSGRVLGFDLDLIKQMLPFFLNAAVLCAFLAYVLYKPVKKMLENRADKIAGQIASAQTQLTEAEELKKQYQEKMVNIETERAEILESARRRAQISEKSIIEDAHKEAETLRNRAKLEIQREQDKLKDEFKQQLIEVSTLMASQYIAAKIDADTQNKILENVISDLGDVKWLS